MNLVFWPNSTFLHCSYLTLFTPPIFWYHYCFHCLPGITAVSRETESEENSYAFFFFLFFFFFGGGWGWWRKRRIAMVDCWKKKASLLGWNLFHKLYTLVFGSRVDLCRCNFNSSTSYTYIPIVQNYLCWLQMPVTPHAQCPNTMAHCCIAHK